MGTRYWHGIGKVWTGSFWPSLPRHQAVGRAVGAADWLAPDPPGIEQARHSGLECRLRHFRCRSLPLAGKLGGRVVWPVTGAYIDVAGQELVEQRQEHLLGPLVCGRLLWRRRPLAREVP